MNKSVEVIHTIADLADAKGLEIGELARGRGQFRVPASRTIITLEGEHWVATLRSLPDGFALSDTLIDPPLVPPGSFDPKPDV